MITREEESKPKDKVMLRCFKCSTAIEISPAAYQILKAKLEGTKCPECKNIMTVEIVREEKQEVIIK